MLSHLLQGAHSSLWITHSNTKMRFLHQGSQTVPLVRLGHWSFYKDSGMFACVARGEALSYPFFPFSLSPPPPFFYLPRNPALPSQWIIILSYLCGCSRNGCKCRKDSGQICFYSWMGTQKLFHGENRTGWGQSGQTMCRGEREWIRGVMCP